jgi:1-acyl-sn-glycerol-3-phosphate acyltransferase
MITSQGIHPVARGLAGVARLLSGVRARHLDPLPYSVPAVYFANHTSHLDTLVLWSSLPASERARTRPVAGRDYWAAGPLRRYISTRVLRVVLVDRGRTAPRGAAGTKPCRQNGMSQMLEVLGAGESLIIFPEGTRGRGDDVGPFRAGLFHLASRRPDVDFVPVYLANLHRILPKGEVLPVPLCGGATFGSPLRIGPGESKEAFLGRARAALLELRQELRLDPPPPPLSAPEHEEVPRGHRP